jgi:mannan endo-1,4-beta-mannosidase
VEEAIAWSRRGGIVAFCWHWRAGPQREFYSGKTDFRIDMDPEGGPYKRMLADIDAVALQLKRLDQAGVPVLWRPLHEASGGWFWWGASGPKPYIALWNLIYDRMTAVHRLGNLIWVWNGQNADWYPGDATVDVVGVDIYGGDKMYNPWKDSWVNAQSYVRGDEARVVALSENGPIPDPDLLVAERAPWSWFMTWNDGVQGKPEDDFFSGNKYMDDAHRKKVYNHPYVLTLDELPGLSE